VLPFHWCISQPVPGRDGGLDIAKPFEESQLDKVFAGRIHPEPVEQQSPPIGQYTAQGKPFGA
jgi:hypothetical protein